MLAQDISAIIDKAQQLVAMPETALEFIERSKDPEMSPAELALIVQKDPVMTAKVLQVANSPFYGMRNIGSVSQAVLIMGIDVTKSIVMLSAMRAVFHPPNAFERKIWEHSIESAVIARKLTSVLLERARMVPKTRPEEAFIAGLLHDIGLMALYRHMPGAILALYDDGDSFTPTIEEEEGALGVHHGAVSAELCRRWGLPEKVAEAIDVHKLIVEGRSVSILADVLYTANEICMTYGVPMHTRPSEMEIEDLPSSRRLALTRDMIERVIEPLIDRRDGLGGDFLGLM